MALDKFWAPVPWMLEAAIVLQVALGEYVEAAIIAALLVFNAALGFFQEGRAQATLAALKSRLALTATVRRNGVWTNLPAAELVPGDIVKLSLGAVVAADVRLVEGSVLLDQSMLTGESIPIEAGPGVPNLCRGAGAARRGRRGGDGDRNAHEVWSNRGACSHCACRKFPAEGCAARGAQSGHVQRHPHRHPGGVCLASRHAACRNHFPRAHGGSCVNPGRAAGHFYSGGGGRRTVSGTPGRSADASLRRGRGGIHRCPVRG